MTHHYELPRPEAHGLETSDDSIYRNFDTIRFDIDISNRIESSKKISNFLIYRDI